MLVEQNARRRTRGRRGSANRSRVAISDAVTAAWIRHERQNSLVRQVPRPMACSIGRDLDPFTAPPLESSREYPDRRHNRDFPRDRGRPHAIAPRTGAPQAQPRHARARTNMIDRDLSEYSESFVVPVREIIEAVRGLAISADHEHGCRRLWQNFVILVNFIQARMTAVIHQKVGLLRGTGCHRQSP